MNNEEKIADLKIHLAVMHEKVRRLEYFFYGLIGLSVAQLLGLFTLWVKQVLMK